MKFTYDTKIHSHHVQLKCFPKDDSRQQIEDLKFNVEPPSELSLDTDHFGNQTGCGYIEQKHSAFSIKVKGLARTGLNIYEDIELDEMKTKMFCYASEYTKIGESLEAYHAFLSMDPNQEVYEKTLYIMRKLAEDLTYSPGVTDTETTAEEAMKIKSGVCQDFSHIMLALCRMEKIPVRYVVGMMQGEGASHAWVEACCKGYWYGFDPTNNLLVDDQHIKFSHGRDYGDCMINKGFFIGDTKQTQDVEVVVLEQ